MMLQLAVEARDLRIGDRLQTGPDRIATVTALEWRSGYGEHEQNVWLDRKVGEFGEPLNKYGDTLYTPDINIDPRTQVVVLREV